jgi:hypothetical protein
MSNNAIGLRDLGLKNSITPMTSSQPDREPKRAVEAVGPLDPG